MKNEKITHLPEEVLDKFIEQDPDMTIKDYIEFMKELELIRITTKYLEYENNYKKRCSKYVSS